MSKKLTMKYGVALAATVAVGLGAGAAMAASTVNAAGAAAPPATMTQAPHHGAVTVVNGVETNGRKGVAGWTCPPLCG